MFETLSLKQCESQLKILNKQYDLNTTISRYTDDIDQAVNALIGLEDRIKFLNSNPNPAPPKPEPVKRPFAIRGPQWPVKTPHGIFENIDQAARELGITRKTM